MSRSVKKIAGGTCAVCKSQKRGKQMSHRAFRKIAKRMIKAYSVNEDIVMDLPLRQMEAVSSWDLGGDGKTVYTWDANSTNGKIWRRK